MSFFNRFRHAIAENSGFETQRYLIKWLVLSLLIGIVAGISAIAFTFAIDFVTHLTLGNWVGYLPPSPAGEGANGLIPILRKWALPLVTALGGLISGIIVFGLAPEAEGHGTDAAIDAIHHKRARIRARIPPIKLIASAITIGTGGSAGREGPTAQMSAGFGSILADWLRLDVHDRRIAVCVGIGSGIGAIFRAPLGGALMAAEILYIHDLEVEALIPTLMASIIGYTIYGHFYGFLPIFGDLSDLGFANPTQLLYYAMLGVLCGLVGLLYSKVFYATVKFFHRLSMPLWLKPAIGGLLVGLIGLMIPGALHTGYGWVQLAMGNNIQTLPLWLILVLPFAKILSTSLSIGSGGSGGIFGPGMVIGGLLGASFWRLMDGIFPGMPAQSAPFAIIGMMSLFGGIAHAPLAVMLMVAEMTGNLSLLAPAMIAVAISTAVVGDHTIYHSQLRTRAESPAHRVKFSFPLLSSLVVRDAMITEQSDFIPTDFPVVLNPNQTLDIALDRLTAHGLSWAPVVDDHQMIGRLNVRDVVQTYKTTLEKSVRRASSLTPETIMFEVVVEDSSALSRRKLRDISLPEETMIVSITHDGHTIFPNADTTLQTGDKVLIMSSKNSENELKTFLGTPQDYKN
jgi:chloride channel protein, CIC family